MVDTGGQTAAADVNFTMTDIVAPGSPFAQVTIADDNFVNATEKAGSTAIDFTHSAASAGDKLIIYRDGVMVKAVDMTAGTGSTRVTLTGSDWGSVDGTVILSARVQDQAGNLSPLSSSKSVKVDTSNAVIFGQSSLLES